MTAGMLPSLVTFVLLAATAALLPRASEEVTQWIQSPDVGAGFFAAVIAIPALFLIVELITGALSVRALGIPARTKHKRRRIGRRDHAPTEATSQSGREESCTIPAWCRTALLVDYHIAAVERAGEWLSGSIYWPIWLRLAGMRIGRRGEISTIIEAIPGLLGIGDECFLADGIYLAPPVHRAGTISLTDTRLSSQSFIGNHAVIPAGRMYPPATFIGVATVAPDPATQMTHAWFGHPPMALPRREVVVTDRSLTHEPSWTRRFNRALWEAARLILPCLPLALLAYWYEWMTAARDAHGVMWAAFIAAPLAALMVATSLVASTIALKWILLGQVRPGMHPLWSCWCSRWDFLYVAWGHWASPILERLEGTLVLNAFLRATGMHLGRRVLLGPGFAHVVDPDMLHFGDDTTIACHFQAHSFEDRVLKIDHVRVERGASLGEESVVLYGATIGADAAVAPHTIVMKRDHRAAGVLHFGAPAQQAPPRT